MGINNWTFRRRAEKTIAKIHGIHLRYSQLSDQALQEQASILKNRARDGEPLDTLLPEAFALAGEASRRVTGMTPYPVQLMGGIALHEGMVAELKTGEGKTLVAVFPAFLNALAGKGVHIVTVNDYLAKRDAESMGKIYEFLGLTVGCVLSGSGLEEKKEAYNCDITYVTNSELGFDYLRDNMAKRESGRVLRGLEYAIVDEVDSILIDEARTPLIISGEGEDVTVLYMACDMLAKRMEKGKEAEFNKAEAMAGTLQEETGDFAVFEKEKAVTLTKDGIRKIEEFFGIKDYADPANINIQHGMEQALKANYTMEKDKDYIVRGDQVLIVDTFTGRILDGRQYSDGLHQAIQAKEGVKIEEASRTVATTTYQSFFNKYRKLAGMTGTAWTERKEFRSTYHLQVAVIPTNRPVLRNDREDVVYLTKKGKLRGILEEVKAAHAAGQPVLIGTASIQSSEEISQMLFHAGIPHEVLNAKQDKREAEIIASAGRYGSVTVATNMAGRGTDIILEERSRSAGGLKVIGTERHESRRIDDQLRGRAGRQGDPGESVFYLSLEDDMVRLFAPERIKKLAEKCGVAEDECLTDRILTSAIRKAQKKVEDNHFGMRKNVLDYDLVIDNQREAVYRTRDRMILGDPPKAAFFFAMDSAIRQVMENNWEKGSTEQAEESLSLLFHMDGISLKGMGKRHAEKILRQAAREAYAKLPALREEKENMIRDIMLQCIDAAWTEELQALEYLKQDVYFTGYAQRDSKSVYAIEAYKLYKKMKDIVHTSAVFTFFQSAPVLLQKSDGRKKIS